MSTLKKRIGDLLTSRSIYDAVVKRSIRDGYLKTPTGYISVDKQAQYLQSLIYWNLYERSEVQLITRYLLKDLPVIEFGASLGKTTSAICVAVNSGVPVYSVEANPRLMASLERTRQKNNFKDLTLKSAAVDYSGAGTISFILDESNLGSRKGDDQAAVTVPTITLGQIVKEKGLKNFSLVCDIEGAELEMFLLEKNQEVIDGCRQIIIELHPASHGGKQYSPNDIDRIIRENFNMEVTYSDGKTWVYAKSSKNA